MANTTEGLGSSGWETQEVEPAIKHSVAIEQDVSTAIAERSNWLAGVWDAENETDGPKQEQVFDAWKTAAPNQVELINSFPSK